MKYRIFYFVICFKLNILYLSFDEVLKIQILIILNIKELNIILKILSLSNIQVFFIMIYL